MKILVGINKSKIQTDNPDILKSLYNKYAFEAEGSFYAKQGRRGWDGKKRFITLGGQFSTGLLSRVVKDLESAGLKNIELEYQYPQEETYPLCFFDNFTYFEHQETIIKRALLQKRAIIKAPTASGKTLMLAGLIKSLYVPGKKMVVVTNQTQLTTQTYEFLLKCKIPSLGICFGKGFILGDIMVCSSKSLDKILDHVQEAACLFVDEVHEFAKGSFSKNVINSFPNAQFRFGFTATPQKKEEFLYELEGAFGPIIEEVSTQELIESKKIAKPVIQFISVPGGELLDGSYASIYDEYVISNPVRNGIIADIVNSIYQKNQKAKTLILVQNLEHGRNLESLIPNSKFLEGVNELTYRYEVIDWFIKNDTNCTLIGTKILQTGISIDEITHYINARGLSSDIATVQALGRALRMCENKNSVFVYDLMDSAKYLKKHSNKRKKHYQNEGHEVIQL